MSVFIRRREAIIMANCRRLIKYSRNTDNKDLYSNIFGVDTDEAINKCIRLGLNPDGKSTNYKVMMKFIGE